jgi:phosphohistidine phosphatase
MEFRLIIMRHAKSDWKSGAATDHQRPLNKRGRKAAQTMGQRIAAVGWIPDLVLCSAATRTRETWDRMCGAFPGDIPVRYLDALYLAGPTELTDALQHVAESHRTVLALGHNPGWEEAVECFSGHARQMKTADAALLTVAASSWAEASVLRGSWDLVDVMEPQ